MDNLKICPCEQMLLVSVSLEERVQMGVLSPHPKLPTQVPKISSSQSILVEGRNENVGLFIHSKMKY
jgi:hypothetical protein